MVLLDFTKISGKRGLDCWNRYSEAAKSILYSFKNGTAFNIHMRENGLIYADAPGKALTWMDAIVMEFL